MHKNAKKLEKRTKTREKPPKTIKVFGGFGAAGQIRTADLILTKGVFLKILVVLYKLHNSHTE